MGTIPFEFVAKTQFLFYRNKTVHHTCGVSLREVFLGSIFVLAFYRKLAKVAALAVEKKKLEKIIFLTYVTPEIPLSSLKKCPLIRSSRLAGYREHIFKCLVLLLER